MGHIIRVDVKQSTCNNVSNAGESAGKRRKRRALPQSLTQLPVKATSIVPYNTRAAVPTKVYLNPTGRKGRGKEHEEHHPASAKERALIQDIPKVGCKFVEQEGPGHVRKAGTWGCHGHRR
jgi:hypothetical protein